MAGKHTAPLPPNTIFDVREGDAIIEALTGFLPPLRGRHHVTCAPAIVKAHYNRWLNSTERQHLTRKEELSG